MAAAQSSTVLWRVTAVAALGACVAFMATRGEPDVLAALGAVAQGWITGGVAGLLWCAGATGLGLWIIGVALPEKERLHAGARLSLEQLALAGSAGAAVMLFLAHGLGVLGLLSGTLGMVLSWAAVMVGVLNLAKTVRLHAARVTEKQNVTPVPWAQRVVSLACVPALAVLTVSVCVPTGTLWESEARGYDSLSYHLGLPKEWAAGGRLWPLEHNAYSWLPSYVEAAYLQLAAMLGGAGTDGRWITACNGLHAGMLGMTGFVVAALARAVARRAEVEERATGWLAGACVLVVPWCVVTGSLSYNEMGMLLGIAGACLVCATQDDRTGTRGVLAGFLLGTATACKPTAAFMGGPLVLMLMLAWTPRGVWWRMLVGAFIGGVAASMPWLVRNWMACGNPVFPSVSSLFGMGPWDAGQIERWNTAHHVPGGLVDAAARLFSDRGVMQQQWSVFFALAALATVVAVSQPILRRPTWPFVVGLLAQLLAWMTIGHQQPRFLLPCVVTGAVLMGVCAGIASCATSRRVSRIGIAMAILGMTWMSIDAARLFMRENGGAPARALVGGALAITGAVLGSDDALSRMDPSELIRALEDAGNPIAATNRLVGLDARRRAAAGQPAPLVYLLGDATPTYFTVPVLWNTVWDRWPLDDALAAAPGDPASWASALRDRGVTHVLVNLSEIERLRSSGYSPPEMTVETARRFAQRLRVVAQWPRIGVALYSLN
jgi:hypothetical protein